MNGVAYELPCAGGLIFDEAQGTCVREDQASSFAKVCEKSTEKRESESTIAPGFMVSKAINRFLCISICSER